mgnify:CR=1 FL=1
MPIHFLRLISYLEEYISGRNLSVERQVELGSSSSIAENLVENEVVNGLVEHGVEVEARVEMQEDKTLTAKAIPNHIHFWTPEFEKLLDRWKPKPPPERS